MKTYWKYIYDVILIALFVVVIALTEVNVEISLICFLLLYILAFFIRKKETKNKQKKIEEESNLLMDIAVKNNSIFKMNISDCDILRHGDNTIFRFIKKINHIDYTFVSEETVINSVKLNVLNESGMAEVYYNHLKPTDYIFKVVQSEITMPKTS